MIEEIVIFYVVTFSIYALLAIFHKNPISFIAFAWFGPIPIEGELFSQFKLRKIKYVFNWFLQFIYLFAVLFLVGSHFDWVEKSNFYLVIAFGTMIGLGMAGLATIGFFVSWLKTKIFGPDGPFIIEFLEQENEDQT